MYRPFHNNCLELGLGFVCLLCLPVCLVIFLDFIFLFQACDSNPCLNGGTCLEEAGGKYSCQCAIGWKGDRCDGKINFFICVSLEAR